MQHTKTNDVGLNLLTRKAFMIYCLVCTVQSHFCEGEAGKVYVGTYVIETLEIHASECLVEAWWSGVGAVFPGDRKQKGSVIYNILQARIKATKILLFYYHCVQ